MAEKEKKPESTQSEQQKEKPQLTKPQAQQSQPLETLPVASDSALQSTITTLQGKVTAYESQIANLQSQLKQSQIKAAVQLALINAKALDADYLAYKLSEKGELELDDKGNIKGIEDKIAGLKAQYPAQFESAQQGGRQIQENKLPEGTNRESEPATLAEALKMQYETTHN